MRFVDFLAACRISVWQLLPIGPVDQTESPYHGFSLHAGRRRFISIERLIESGWLSPDQRDSGDWLRASLHEFDKHASPEDREALASFKQQNNHWLEDYALFQVIRSSKEGEGWWNWSPELRARQPDALDKICRDREETLEQYRFEQFLFFDQWHQLKAYAHVRGVELYGDLPIYPAHDSADVWANQDQFLLDEEGQPLYVAGVPPDAFSTSGQRWGNPVYDWDKMRADGFAWWWERIRTNLDLFDCLRIDHFRGLEASWYIPASSPTAEEGEWHPVPGYELLSTLRTEHPSLPFIAEDLGLITAEVECLRDEFELPGMRVLQFAFEGDGTNPHLPHNHPVHCVTFTGTHDNNTTLGWYKGLDTRTRKHVRDYMGHPSERMPWPMIRMNLASVAGLAIMPMQDLLGLDEKARMNTPATTDGNWLWRFGWEDFGPELQDRVAAMVEMYSRA